MTDPIIVGYAANLGSELTLKVLSFLGQHLRTTLFGTPQQEAVQRCYQTATEILLPNDDAASEAYRPIMQTLFEQPAVQAELAKLAKGRLPDQTELFERFEEACSDRFDLPPYGFSQRLAAAVEAFFDTASTEPDLVNTIIAGQSRHLAEEVRAIRQTMEQANETTIPIPKNTSPALRKTVEALDSSDHETRKSNVQTIANSNDPMAFDILLAAVRHPTWDVCANALFQLVHFSDSPSMIPTLIEVLGDGDWGFWNTAREKLVDFGESAVPPLLTALSHEKPMVRYGATSALKKISHPSSVPELIKALYDENASVRCGAAGALGNLKVVDAIPTLAKLLSDTVKPEWTGQRVCDAADIALQEIGTPEALEARKAYPG